MRREPRLDGPGGELRALLLVPAPVVRALHRSIDGERVRIRMERRDGLHVEGERPFLVAGSHQIVEHRRFHGRKLLVEEVSLARLESGPECGALGSVRELRDGHQQLDVELADRPEIAAGGNQRDAQARKRVDVLAAPLCPPAACGREDQDGTRRIAPALGRGFDRLGRHLDEHVVGEGLREQQVAHHQERPGVLREPRIQHLALGAPHALEVEEPQPGTLDPSQRRPSPHAGARARCSGGGAGAGRHGQHPRPGRCHVERDHGHLAERHAHEAKNPARP